MALFGLLEDGKLLTFRTWLNHFSIQAMPISESCSRTGLHLSFFYREMPRLSQRALFWSSFLGSRSWLPLVVGMTISIVPKSVMLKDRDYDVTPYIIAHI